MRSTASITGCPHVRNLLALVVVVAACGAPRRAPAPATNAAPPTAPTTPPPAITVSETMGFALAGLPAITADGTRVVVGVIEGDGGRGNPNLRLELRDRRDVTVETVGVQTIEEADLWAATPATRDARITAANRWLATLHASANLSPLAEMTVDQREGMFTQHLATRDGVTVDWRDSRLSIAHLGKPVHNATTPATWLAPDRPLCATCGETCHNPPFLDAAYLDLAHTLVLLTIAYHGTDMCWEPGDQHHVVTW